MNGSYRYLHPLESVHDLLRSYPMRAEMSSVNFTSDPAGRASVTVQLRDADPAVLAAGLVEWQRTLYPPEIWAWRNAATDGVHIVVSGFGPECDKTPIAVLAGPIPHTPRLDTALEPGTPRRLDPDTLHSWFGLEILHSWPFQPIGATP
jgi:hypothetical protein